jgi:hypothetical protein
MQSTEYPDYKQDYEEITNAEEQRREWVDK